MNDLNDLARHSLRLLVDAICAQADDGLDRSAFILAHAIEIRKTLPPTVSPAAITLTGFEPWLAAVRAALDSINMPMAEWQRAFPYDFAADHGAGIAPAEAARRANDHYWRAQEKATPQLFCRKAASAIIWFVFEHMSDDERRRRG